MVRRVPSSSARRAAVGPAAAAAPRSLVRFALAASTQKRYDAAVKRFLAWAAAHDADTSSASDLDHVLTDYFNFLFQSSGGKLRGLAEQTLSGLRKLLPECKQSFHLASQALQGYTRRQPKQQHPPMSWPLAVAVAVHLVAAGLFRHGVGVVLSHHCLLRVSELTGMKREDVADWRDSRLDLDPEQRVTVIRLRSTKTGQNQSVIVEDPSICELLRLLVVATEPGGLLFPFTPSDLSMAMQAACAQYGLTARYTPHSLRHGGATRLFLRKWRVEDIMVRGRWANTVTTRHYIQSGPGLLLAMAVPADVFDFGRTCAGDLVRAFTLAQKHSS